MIFQDAMSSLNPVFTIREQMGDILRAARTKGTGLGPAASTGDTNR